MKERTIRSHMSLLLGIALGILSIAVVLSATVYYRIKTDSLIDQNKEKLMATTENQVNQLLISYLIPEQRSGLQMLLDNFQKKEGLSHSKIVKQGKKIENFSDCAFLDSPQACLDDEKETLAILAPLKEGQKIYGYYLKTKAIDFSSVQGNVLTVSMVAVLTLLAAFFMFMYLIAKLTSSEIPSFVNKITVWVHRALNEEDELDPPKGRFKELNDLTTQIDQAIKMHVEAKNQNLELQKSAAISDLASKVVHDIRSPLAVIGGITRRFQEGKIDKRRVSALAGATKNLEDIAEDLLVKKRQMLMKSKHKKSEYFLITDFLKSVCTELLHGSYDPRFKAREIQRDIPFLYIDVRVWGHTSDLKRCLKNLIINASEALSVKSNGEPCIKLSLKIEKGNAVIKISDNGPGIPESIRNDIFKVSVSKNKPKGNGLGLISAKEIIERHVGDISFETSDLGTTFTILLPIPKELYTVRVEGTDPVLIIEDDDFVREYWHEKIEKSGLKAISRDKFSDELKNQKYSCIISDQKIEGQSHKTGLDFLKGFPKSVPRYLCTGFANDMEIIKQCDKEDITLFAKGLLHTDTFQIEKKGESS